MEVPRLGVELELQVLATATATATATWDPSRVCKLHHNSWQHQILNPLREARDQTQNLMVPSQICFHCATTELLFSFSFTISWTSFHVTPSMAFHLLRYVDEPVSFWWTFSSHLVFPYINQWCNEHLRIYILCSHQGSPSGDLLGQFLS